MSQLPAGLGVVISTDPEVEQAIPEAISYGWRGSELSSSCRKPYDAHQSCRKPKNILGIKEHRFWILLAIFMVVALGGLAGGLGGRLALLKSSSSITK